jgi:hypothetical protein
MIVVDSKVLAYLYLPGDYTEAAERRYQRERNGTRRSCGAMSTETSWPDICGEAS